MNCENLQSRLTALLDGELPEDEAAAAERHLAGCSGCTQARAELLAVKKMASAWNTDVPDTSARVLAAIAAGDQRLLLDEVRLLRTEMEALRSEVTMLRRQLSPRSEPSWTPSARCDPPKDYPQMENDPWNLIRS